MKFGLAALGAACAIAAALPGVAVAGTPSAVVTITSTATLAFDATNMTNTALTSTPASASASVVFTTTVGGAGGTVTVVPGTLTGTSGGVTLSASDFTLTCKLISGSGFTAAPAAVLNGATTCGTLAAGKTNATCTFSVVLTLNDTLTAAIPFDATTYLGTFTVSATAS
jgi:hypothetical protein